MVLSYLLLSYLALPYLIYSIRFAVARGKEGIIDFVRGSELKVAKGKRGHLLVVSGFFEGVYRSAGGVSS